MQGGGGGDVYNLLAAKNRTKNERKLGRENAWMRKKLGMTPNSVQEWERSMPQAKRDAFAARALVVNNGNPFHAALFLGFPPPEQGKRQEYIAAVIVPVFETPGCRAMLDRELSKPNELKDEILARAVEIALFDAPETAVKAMTWLSRVCGWTKPEILVQNNRATILTLVQNQLPHKKAAAALQEITEEFLTHEPGAAKRVDSDSELVDAALELPE